MAGKCGCAGTTCSCKITGAGGISVTGAGTASNPYVISGGGGFTTQDTATVDLTLLGSGSTTDPFILSANVSLGLGDLTDVDDSVTTAGYVLARDSGGGFYFAPPATVAVGAISVGQSIEGDGSGGDPLDVKLAANSGLEIVSAGLRLDPYTVTDEANLDSTYGSLPAGAIVADDDGSNVWVKSTSGWSALLEDTGTITTISGNIVEASGWDIDSFKVRRRNGIVQLWVLATRTALLDSNSTGNIGNVAIGTITPAKFRPVFTSAAGAGAEWGPMVGAWVNVAGVLAVGAISPGVDVAAGTQISFHSTYIGQ